MKPLHRLLLVEDDAVSRTFFTTVLEDAGHAVDAAHDAASARALAHTPDSPYSLLLIDAHLPDADGADLLHDLRAVGIRAPAVAHTAEHSPPLHQRLRSAGFDRVLLKPLPVKALRDTVDGMLRQSGHAPAPMAVWDDQAASRSLGGASAQVGVLRDLFLAELEPMATDVVDALRCGERGRAGDVLHRLQASCGFVGATRVAEAVRGLRQHVDAGAIEAFERAVRDTLADRNKPDRQPTPA